MYKRILVPLDGSPFSEEVIPHAAGLAAVHGTELVLLRVFDEAANEDPIRSYVDQLAAAHGAHGLCVAQSGDVALALLREFDREPQTLLAMTSRGHSGLAEVVLGSVAQRVMRNIKGPVLMYRPNGAQALRRAPVRPSNIVLPLDGSAPSEAMADDAGAFARWAHTGLEVVSAVSPRSAAMVGEPSGGEITSMESGYVRSKARELGKQYDVPVSWEVLYGNPVEAIVNHVAHRQDVILAMATRRHDALQAALLGSVTAGCLRKAGVPVLMRLT